MKKLISLTGLILIAGLAFAQQEPQFTQFMYNKLGYNPGYAGSNDGTCFTGLIRQQWLGLDGAPGSQLFSFNMPLNDQKVGIGLNIWRNTIGVSQTMNIEGAYAYRLQMDEGTLGIGLMGSGRYLQSDFAKTDPIQSGDPTIAVGMQSKFVPNFGVGAYFSNDKFFVGASAPRILQNNIDLGDDQTVISREFRHLYLMGGLVFPLSENTEFQPQILIKYVQNAPLDADLNMNLIFLKKYSVGASYRFGGSTEQGIGESVDILLGAQLTEDFMIGFAYDVTLSELRTYNNGTIEAMVRYCIKGGGGGDEYLNPRFF